MLIQQGSSSTCLQNLYACRAAFLICGGPSLTSHDLSLLSQWGILTCAVNNAAVVHRPQLWVSVDDPGNFCDAIWRDPGIWKFVPQDHFDKPLVVRDEQGQLIVSEEKVHDMPTVFGYQRNEVFNPSTWLHEPTFNWGNHSSRRDEDGNKGSRSVMYVALKLLYYLGVRRVYLIGCDFRMDEGQQNYAFEQDRTARSVRGNNSSYRTLNARLSRLKPEFDKADFEVFNCTPNSGLTVFPFLDYGEAIADCTRMMPQRISTAGMYDRLQRERDARKQAERAANVEQARNNYKAASSGMAIPPLTLT